MTASTKKLIGSLIMMAGLLVYILIALVIGSRLPHTVFVELPYYIVAGTLWVLPAKAIITWMHR